VSFRIYVVSHTFLNLGTDPLTSCVLTLTSFLAKPSSHKILSRQQKSDDLLMSTLFDLRSRFSDVLTSISSFFDVLITNPDFGIFRSFHFNFLFFLVVTDTRV
jgi:hypothetical protein